MTRPQITLSALIIAAAATASYVLVVAPAWAQAAHEETSGADPLAEARRGIAALGGHWDAAAFTRTASLYTEVHRDVEWPGVRAAETISYGSDPQQHMRLFAPEQGFSEPGPVFVFLHGNGLGDSDQVVPASDELIYGNVGKLGARYGGIGITANYRHADVPGERAGAEDIAAVVAWITEHIASYGGDPNTIVLLANSDGARHAAMYLFDSSIQPAPGPGFAAAILSSGTFATSLPFIERLIEDYDGVRTPLALWSAQYDPAPVEISTAEVYAAICRKYQDCPSMAQLPGHNHVSQVMSLGSDDMSVQTELLRFYHTVR